MDINRFINVVMSDLSLENLKLQDNLEVQINSQEQIETKVLRIKTLLEKIVINDLMISKFKSLVAPIIDNKNENTEDNGKI
jgi:hypothetical protein